MPARRSELCAAIDGFHAWTALESMRCVRPAWTGKQASAALAAIVSAAMDAEADGDGRCARMLRLAAVAIQEAVKC